MNKPPLRVGLILNPIAGIGGPVALKGSDGVVAQARARGSESQVAGRAGACIRRILSALDDVEAVNWVTMPGEMGADVLYAEGAACTVLGEIEAGNTTADDTRRGVVLLDACGIDLLLFVGGDGTARDIVDVWMSSPDQAPAPLSTQSSTQSTHLSIPAFLGIPGGVKMHSGVFATTPRSAAEVVLQLARGELLSVVDREVRDIDESALREGRVEARWYGELPVPDDLRYIQHTKVAGREVEALAVEDIAAGFIESLETDLLYLMGSGSTVATLMAGMSLDNTLLGIDAVLDGQVIARDLTEQQLWQLLQSGRPARIVITAIGGQGNIFGRGNQQFSPRVIRRVGRRNIILVATRTKLAGLASRPLLVDTGDETLDAELSGLLTVYTGYEDRVLYPVAS